MYNSLLRNKTIFIMKPISFLLFFLAVSITAQKTINASDIMSDIKKGKNISYKNITIDGTLDFTFMDDALPNLPKRRRWWNGNGSNEIKKRINVAISFENCIFTDNVLAYIPDESGYTFTASFYDDVTFKHCTFEKKAMFKYSKFDRKAIFKETKFEDDSTFKYAEFYSEVTFTNTLFSEVSTFKFAIFKNNVSFANATFKDSAIFKYTKFKEGVSFRNTHFEEDLNLKYTVVRGSFDITNMKVGYDIDSKYTSINGKSFSKHFLNN